MNPVVQKLIVDDLNAAGPGMHMQYTLELLREGFDTVDELFEFVREHRLAIYYCKEPHVYGIEKLSDALYDAIPKETA